MDKMMDVSIIIPCHNLEDWISPLLHSLNDLNLTHIEAECIFVLDGCIDRTKDLIIETMQPDYRIIECEVRSCGLARNEGLKVATGEFIWFVDGDDWIEYPDILDKIIPFMRSCHLPIMRMNWRSNYYEHHFPMMVWQYIFRRDLIGNSRFLSIQPSEDTKFMDLIRAKIPRFAIPEYNSPPVYFYNYKRPGSNTTQFAENKKIIF